MSAEFQYDVFLSHSAQDKTVVRPLAERLRQDGLKVPCCPPSTITPRPPTSPRRFIPLRLDDTPIKGSLAQFLYVNWRPADREQQYAKLLEACRPPELRWMTKRCVTSDLCCLDLATT